MPTIQISKIQLRRGPASDLPGEPSSLGPPPVFPTGLDDGELGFTTDEGRLFIGQSTTDSSMQTYLRVDYPYQNIEVITENSPLGVILRPIIRDNQQGFITAIPLIETDTFTTLQIRDALGDAQDFNLDLLPPSGVNARVHYYVFDVDSIPLRQGVLSIIWNGTSEPLCVDDATVAVGDVDDIEWTATEVSDHVVLQYKNSDGTPTVWFTIERPTGEPLPVGPIISGGGGVAVGATGPAGPTGTIGPTGPAGSGGSGPVSAASITGILPASHGGTNVDASTASNGQVLIGNGTGFTLSTLSAGSNIAIANSSGQITISATSGGGTGSAGGGVGQVQYNIGSGNFGGFTLSGDATLNTSSGVLAVTKTNGVAFVSSATTDTTNASNITSGSLSLARIPSMANNTVLGNVSGSSAAPIALTRTQLTALMNVFASGTSGSVPASGGGTTNFLRADGSWSSVLNGILTCPTASFGSIVTQAYGGYLTICGAPLFAQGADYILNGGGRGIGSSAASHEWYWGNTRVGYFDQAAGFHVVGAAYVAGPTYSDGSIFPSASLTGQGYQLWGNSGGCVAQYTASGWKHVWDTTFGNYVFYNSGGTPLSYTTGGGDFHVLGNVIAANVSDERTKKDVERYTRSLSDIVKLNPISFRYNGEGSTKDDGVLHYGLTAQASQPFIPECVNPTVRGPLDPTKPDAVHPHLDNQLSLDPAPLTFALINCVKELTTRLETAEAKLQTAMERIASLEA